MRYLDNAASTQVDPRILDSYHNLLERFYANPSSMHKLGRETSELIDKSREIISSLLVIKNDEIIFTSGASEANNLAIKGVCFQYQNRGKHIITTNIEHPSVLEVYKQLEEKFGFEVTYLKANIDGIVTVEDLKKALRPDTILVSVMFVNNEIGSINNIEEIAKFLKENAPKVIFHTDATQGFGKYRIDLKNIDLLSMSAHKIHGLKGCGMLVKKENINLFPLIAGGHQELGLRAGTSPFANIAMTAKAIKLAYEEMDKNYKYVSYLNNKIREAIKDVKGVIINSPVNGTPYILNLSFEGKKAAILSTYFEEHNICVSTVSACGSKENVQSYVINNVYTDVSRAESSIRLSFSKYTSEEDVQDVIDVIRTVFKDLI